MTPEEIAAKEKADADAASKADAEAKAKADATPPTAIAKELERVRTNGDTRTELDKALYKKKQLDKRIKELGGEPDKEEPEEETDDNAPVTVKMLKQIEAEKATKTALNLADEQITDADERELTKHYLLTKIIPSGNPTEDLRFARSAVNSLKNSQIAEEAHRRTTPTRTTSGGGAPAHHEETFTPTNDEASMMRPPFNLTKDEVLKARQKAEAK